MTKFYELAPSQHRPTDPFHNGYGKGPAQLDGYAQGLSPDSSDHSVRAGCPPNGAAEKYYEADFEFSPITAPYVVAADNVLFGVSESFMGQSALFLREMPHLSANAPLHLEDHVKGPLNRSAVRVFVRMVENMIQPVHLHLPVGGLALEPNTEANMELLGVALQLALELNCDAAYRYTMALLHLLASEPATPPTTIVNMFCLASVLDEEALAGMCAARLAQSPCHADYWAWPPQVARAVPSQYIWSLQRALHAPKQLPPDETHTINNTVAAAFLTFLAEIKAFELNHS